MRDIFLLKFDCNLFMLDIKVLTNGVQFPRNYHMENFEIFHFKYYFLINSFKYIYIIINWIFHSFLFCGAIWHFSGQLHNL